MAIETIPTSADPAYRQTTVLSGREYRLDFDFVERDGVHRLSISVEGVPLINGLALLPGRLLLQGLRADDRPPGDLLLLSEDLPPLGAFGDGRATLVYLTDDDLDAARAILAGATLAGATSAGA